MSATKPAPDFAEFMRTRERISHEYISGNAAPLQAILTSEDPATFFPPNGTHQTGASIAGKAQIEGAKAFTSGSSGRFEVLQQGASGTLAFWTDLQHATIRMHGKSEPVEMVLRTTEIFRLEDGTWKLVHRHADFAKDK